MHVQCQDTQPERSGQGDILEEEESGSSEGEIMKQCREESVGWADLVGNEACSPVVNDLVSSDSADVIDLVSDSEDALAESVRKRAIFLI